MRMFFAILILINLIFFSIANIVQANTIDNKDKIAELVDYFFAAARLGDNEIINRFLDAGFPINQSNEQSYTALMVAAYNGQYETTALLLQRGANACLQDKRGNTAIMGALIKAEVRITRLLYNQSCDESLTNKSGLTVEAFAQYWGQSDALTNNE
ncbi:ankyrin repeat domain-containing protein [Shewanella surugensis]|uniref:Ankyrin repeat domain-containing protein n=1 Tax=Shewanella surugensis TaxID=212020 RepID=A0ABT0L8G3_9GAMM|nr:ankyrin repeat domain-containing protein [Shewanella surugensis]MCL1123971.1 ankyrin repeat domain-containing protein [Shewanella surugensis]